MYRPFISAFRMVTWSQRVNPELIIVGAQKAGTTSLFNYLQQHPQLVPSFKKEVHFFDSGLEEEVDTFTKGEAWYRANFPLVSRMDSNQKAFEASPYYLYHPMAAERIYNYAPDIKLIALLRNPTDRAVSHYFHEVRRGAETLPIMEAMEMEEERLRPIIKSEHYKSESLHTYSYKARGNYYDQLKVYLEYFDLRNILILESESLFSETQNTLRKVYDFADVDEDFVATDLKPMNVGINKVEVSVEVREYLDNYFKPKNMELYGLVGEDYGWG